MIKGAASGSYDIDTYNQEAFDHFNTVALVACGCGRTFLPESLVKHQKTCKMAHATPNNNAEGAAANPASKTLATNAKASSLSAAKASALGAAGASSLGAAGANLLKKPQGAGLKPKSLVCYICGREFGTASLEIHLKTCKKKWEYEQDKKPPNERRPCPQPPENFD